MQPPELSLAWKLDSNLTKGLCLLFGWLINTSMWLLGLSLLVDQASQIFEYGEGLADVSWDEWGFMLLFVLLFWRYIRHCRHFAAGFWRGLSRLLTFQGRLVCVGLSIFGLVIGFEQQLGTPVNLLITIVDPVTELTAFGFVLLALYLAAPTATAESSRPITTFRMGPTLTTAEKEVTV